MSTCSCADLCSYFLLRNLDISWRGRVGIIATNTIAQGDTREVGLDQAVGNGVSVYRAVKSQPWPGTASLEVSLIWVGHASDGEPRTLDGRPVRAICRSPRPRRWRRSVRVSARRCAASLVTRGCRGSILSRANARTTSCTSTWRASLARRGCCSSGGLRRRRCCSAQRSVVTPRVSRIRGS